MNGTRILAVTSHGFDHSLDATTRIIKDTFDASSASG